MASPLVRRRRRLAWIGLVGNGAFVVGLLVLHATAIRDEPSHMSQFANSRFALFWEVSVFTFILGASVLVWALRPCLGDGLSKRAGMSMLGLAGFGAVLLATFPTDAFYPISLRGTIHDDAALATFVLLGAAMVVLAPALRASPSLGRFARASVVLGVLVTASWILYLTTTLQDLAVRGPVQRILVALIVTWFTMLALRLRKVADADADGEADAEGGEPVPMPVSPVALAARRPRRRRAPRNTG